MSDLFPGLTLGQATRDAYGEALRDLGREHPDIVVLDMMLPGRSGFLVLEKIKAMRAAHEVAHG